MKVLLTAYACSPERGSEPKVGWDAVLAISRQHECWVLTSTKFKQEIERWLIKKPLPNVHFVYHGSDYRWWGNGMAAKLQTWFLYHRWQKSVIHKARHLCETIKFDVAQHVTLTAWRIPPKLWKLPIPFVWGPVGGTAEMPPQFLNRLGVISRYFEKVRKLHTFMVLHSAAFKNCVQNAAVIIAANNESKRFFRQRHCPAKLLTLPVVYFSAIRVHELRRPAKTTSPSPLRLFAGGTLQGSKGVALAIQALKKVKDAGIDFSYVVAGHGSEVGKLKQLVDTLQLSDRVTISKPFTGKDYLSQLHAADVYLMPSFRETTPVTLLEAMLAGCYPVVADASASGEIVRELGGSAVACSAVEELINNLAEAIIEIAHQRDKIASEAKLIADRVAEKYCATHYANVINQAYALASS